MNKKAFVHKEVYSGPSVRYSSKDGKFSLFFPLPLSPNQACLARCQSFQTPNSRVLCFIEKTKDFHWILSLSLCLHFLLFLLND